MAETVDLPRLLELTGRLLVTETTNEARLEVAASAGVKRVQFSAIIDGRTSPLCRHLDGQVFAAGSPEAARYQPPLHINCRSIWVEVGDDEVGAVDAFDPDDPALPDLVAKHGHFVRDPDKYAPLKIPASPGRRDFVFRRHRDAKTGELVSHLEWQRPRYELPGLDEATRQSGVRKTGPRWTRLDRGGDGGDGGGGGSFLPPKPKALRERGQAGGAGEALPPGQPAPPAPLPDRVRRLVDAFNSHLAGIEGHEESVALRLDGTMVGRRSGRPRQVIFAIPPDGGAEVVVLHNHTGGTSFSPADFESACRAGIHELQAVWRGGGQQVTYRLQRPENGWPDVAEARRVLDSYGSTLEALRADHPEWDGPTRTHEVAQRVAARLGLRYTREQGPTR